MQLKDRISIILKENMLKQKEFANILGVSDSYVSAILSGRNVNLSTSLAILIEEKFGYNAQWVLSGSGDRLKVAGTTPSISSIHKRAIIQLEKLPEKHVVAVLAFMDALDKIDATLNKEGL